MASQSAHWRLIAVLQSTVSLSSPLAFELYFSALRLHREKLESTPLVGDSWTGELRALGRELLLGSIGGPGFEATLDTTEGSGLVRFVITREGMAALEETPEQQLSQPLHKPVHPKLLN